MPEAAVNEDGGFVFGEEDVGGNGARTTNGRSPHLTTALSTSTARTPHPRPSPQSGEGVDRWRRDRNADVETEAEAHSIQERADAHFGVGVLAANAAHVPGTAFWCEGVFFHDSGAALAVSALIRAREKVIERRLYLVKRFLEAQHQRRHLRPIEIEGVGVPEEVPKPEIVQ